MYTANAHKSSPQLTWDSLNGHNQPFINYDAFDARWNSSDPDHQQDVQMLRKLVKRYNNKGVVLNAGAPEQKTGGSADSGMMAQAAKRATNRAFS